MRYRAVANGNIVDDVPESLVTAGIYEPVDGGDPEPVEATPPAPDPEPEPDQPQTDDTAVAPMTTEDMPAPPKKAARRKRRR